MNNYWSTLSIREKKIVSIGSVLAIVLLSYLLVLSPLQNSITTLKKQINQDQDLLTWMKEADKHIHILEEKTQPIPIHQKNKSLLTIVQNEIKNQPFASSLTKLDQTENKLIKVTFINIDFDKFIAWFIPFVQHNALVVTQMTVTPHATKGMVSIDIELGQK